MGNMRNKTMFWMKRALHTIFLSMKITIVGLQVKVRLTILAHVNLNITPDQVISLNPPIDFHKTTICL